MRIKLAILGVFLVAIVSVTFVAVAQTPQTMSLSGNAHLVTSSGITRYSSDAKLNVILNTDGKITLEGPVNVYERRKVLVATFNLKLVGTKNGNRLVFDDNLSTATVLETRTDQLTNGEELYAPGWDGQWTTNNRVKLDGDIYRPPDKTYLDVLLTLSGTAE